MEFPSAFSKQSCLQVTLWFGMHHAMLVSPVPCDRLVSQFCKIVGRRHVLTGSAAAPFAKGYRFGSGPITAAVRPGSLVEMWRVAQACVAADRILIVQAANTGLTGGSTPDGRYDREVVVISTSRITGIIPILDGKQVVCLAGASLYDLERRLGTMDREAHSVIGSSCIGASVVGGVCNNSGGALVSRGPAYTEYAIYAQIGEDGVLRLRNRLGIELGEDAETILTRLDEGSLSDADIEDTSRAASAASDYASVVRAVDEDGAARFNADPARLFEASGSAGRLIVFAVRLDTFPKIARSTVFYIGTNDPADLTAVRRQILLEAEILPVSGEYVHREAFDLADTYGKDTVLAIGALGTNRLPRLFAAKAWFDRVAGNLLNAQSASDRLLQRLGRMLPDHLPRRIRGYRERFEHHLIIAMPQAGTTFVRTTLERTLARGEGDFFECTAREAERAMLHRFAVAGAAVRYRALRSTEVEDIVALDISLPRNAREWFEQLPADIEQCLVAKLYYGHFFCHVFHQDYIVRKGADAVALEHRLLALMKARGAEYPAEHNVGHLYEAKPVLAEHYRSLDPTNQLNPGIGKTSRAKWWK